MNGPSMTSATQIASTLGTNASVASLICVIACTSAITRPTASATSSGGPASLSITSMPSRSSAAMSASFMVLQPPSIEPRRRWSDRHLHDVLIGLHDAVADGGGGLQGELGARQGGDDVGQIPAAGERLHGLGVRRVEVIDRSLHGALQCGAEVACAAAAARIAAVDPPVGIGGCRRCDDDRRDGTAHFSRSIVRVSMLRAACITDRLALYERSASRISMTSTRLL